MLADSDQTSSACIQSKYINMIKHGSQQSKKISKMQVDALDERIQDSIFLCIRCRCNFNKECVSIKYRHYSYSYQRWSK